MKIKRTVSITDPKDFLKGNLGYCFGLYEDNGGIDGWVNNIAEVEFEVPNDAVQKCRDATLSAIEKKELELKANLALLEQAKGELLSIGFEGGENE